MSVAAIWGTTVGYTEVGDMVNVETHDGRVIIISIGNFEYLYRKLDNFTAAFKTDCIEYVDYDSNKPLNQYPDWYIQAVRDGQIFDSCGIRMFYDERGEMAISPKAVILRNFMGDLMYMESDMFHKHYDRLEGN